MMCPECHSAYSEVTSTRKIRGSRIRRYRVCKHCGHPFSTTEIVNPPKLKAPKLVEPEPEDGDLDDENYYFSDEE